MRRRDTAYGLAATALGLGVLPVAPGTWSSAGAGGLFVLAALVLPGLWAAVLLGAGVGVTFSAGLALGPWAERRYGRADPRQFVLDEVAGQWLTYALCFWAGRHLAAAAVGFVAFRFFDVWKPFPARQLEKLGARWGVMLDDVAAAFYAAAVWCAVVLCLSLKG